MIKAAGTMIITGRDGKALFLQRSGDSDHPGEWCFPGGKLEPGETTQDAAERETREEIGAVPYGRVAEWTRQIADDVDFTTFVAYTDAEFTPKLDHEHTAWAWAPISSPPEPLHPGCRVALDRLTMDELGVAQAIAAGSLVSPQRYGNFWLYAIRITGTGLAYRVGLDEYCWRDPSLYLNDRFLQRCNGIPVLWTHTETPKLNSEEYRDKNVGSVFLPYIKGEEVWAVCKIYDDACLGWLMDGDKSTSPGVVFSGTNDNQTLKRDDGATLLIEGTPQLLDHIALCDVGVWDKGGPPKGVDSFNLIESGRARTSNNMQTERLDREFNEADHPRAADGKFGSGGGSSKTASLVPLATSSDGKRTMPGGRPLPEHIVKLKLPPAWTDVRVSEDPSAGLQAQGKDAKGRLQSVYSAEHSAKQAAEKFSRIHLLVQEFPSLEKQNAAKKASSDPKEKDTADCLDLIMKMGVRPGSDDDTGADKKAYGASTLKGEHVVSDGDDVYLRFTGKKGVSINLKVTDKYLAENLKDRAIKAGADGNLFPNTNDKRLLEHAHSLDSGKFKTKDFRTHLGTKTAAELVKSMPPPKSEKEYVKAVKEVASKVAAALGNTPVIALQSYISPAVFSEWGIRG